MHLAIDYIHPYEGDAGVCSQCRIRLYLPYEDTDAAVVICSKPMNNRETSITNAVEQIAAEVIAHFKLPVPPVWIQHHYPPEATSGAQETFDLVVFAHHDIRETVRGGIFRKQIGPPTRKPLDREIVEMLVGQHV